MSSRAAILTVIAWHYPRTTPFAVVFVLLMGFARVHNGMHYPTDVLAGTVLGTICGALAIFAVARLRARRERPAAQAQDAKTLRIGFQKYGTLTIVRALGDLDDQGRPGAPVGVSAPLASALDAEALRRLRRAMGTEEEFRSMLEEFVATQGLSARLASVRTVAPTGAEAPLTTTESAASPVVSDAA